MNAHPPVFRRPLPAFPDPIVLAGPIVTLPHWKPNGDRMWMLLPRHHSTSGRILVSLAFGIGLWLASLFIPSQAVYADYCEWSDDVTIGLWRDSINWYCYPGDGSYVQRVPGAGDVVSIALPKDALPQVTVDRETTVTELWLNGWLVLDSPLTVTSFFSNDRGGVFGVLRTAGDVDVCLGASSEAKFMAALDVVSGVTEASGTVYTYPVLVESGATLQTGPISCYTSDLITHGTVQVNGTIVGASYTSLLAFNDITVLPGGLIHSLDIAFGGSSFTNQGVITSTLVHFMEPGQVLSGVGEWQQSTLVVDETAEVSLLSDVRLSHDSTLENYGKLSLNGHRLSVEDSTLRVHELGALLSMLADPSTGDSAGVATEGSAVRAEGTSLIANSGIIEPPLEIASGTTTVWGTPWPAVTVAAGATLSGGTAVAGHVTIQPGGRLDNRAKTLTLDSSLVTIVNNGIIDSAQGVIFFAGPDAALTNNGLLDLTDGMLHVSAPGTPAFENTGDLILSGSTALYDGSAPQGLPPDLKHYHNLTIDNLTEVTGVADLVVDEQLVLTEGTFTSLRSIYHDVAIGSILFLALTPTLALDGDITITGDLVADCPVCTPPVQANGRDVIFAGSGVQSVSARYAPLTLAGLVVNEGVTLLSAGKVSAERMTNLGTVRVCESVYHGEEDIDFGLTDVIIQPARPDGLLYDLCIERVDASYPDAPDRLRTGRYWTIALAGEQIWVGANVVLPHSGLTEPGFCRLDPFGEWDCSQRRSFTAQTVTGSGYFHDPAVYTVGDFPLPVTPYVSIQRVDNDVILGWANDPANEGGIEVFYARAPYFTPTTAYGYAWLPAGSTGWTHQEILLNPTDNYYYMVRASNALLTTSDLSNQTGIFSFSLLPGAQ